MKVILRLCVLYVFLRLFLWNINPNTCTTFFKKVKLFGPSIEYETSSGSENYKWGLKMYLDIR